MAKKFEIIGNSLQITNTDSSEILLSEPRASVWYLEKKLNEGVVRVSNIDPEDNAVLFSCALSEAIDKEGNNFDEDSMRLFFQINLGNKSGGGNGQGVAFSLKSTEEQAYDVSNEDNGSLISLNYDGDWSVVLPSLDSVSEGFTFTAIHKKSDINIGSIVPFGSDLIEGSSNIAVFGKGALSVRKKEIQGGGSEWFVSNRVSYDDVHLQGKVREYDFTNEDFVEVIHDFGFVPIVQVWVEDGDEGYVQANVDIDHNWISKSSFVVDFGIVCSGKIIY